MKGILFKPTMIEAVQREVNPKTQTRRLTAQHDFEPIKIEYETKGGITIVTLHGEREEQKKKIRIPYAKGETVYIKEPWSPEISTEEKWKSPMFMKAKFARIFLKISDVRIERVANISDADCLAEGIEVSRLPGIRCALYGKNKCYRPRQAFAELWNSINAKPKKNKKLDKYFRYPFSHGGYYPPNERINEEIIANPWVAVITFRKVKHDSI